MDVEHAVDQVRPICDAVAERGVDALREFSARLDRCVPETFRVPVAAGDPVLGVPGQGNMGVLQAGALEESNIDLTGELVAMITAQRTYQANAQTIKTQDQVLQTLVNLR